MGTHDTRTAPEISGTLDLDGTEMTAGDEGQAPGGSIRSFRAGSRGIPAPDAPDHDDDKHDLSAAHGSRGPADHRRDRNTILTPTDEAAAPELYSNQRTAVTVNPENPPARPRQGFTGADPARTAQALRPTLLRPFDKAIADHPGQVLKVTQAGPLAARPKTGLADVAHGQPFAGGQTGTQAYGVGPGRNSFRIMPKAWDALVVNTGGPAVSVDNPDPAQTAAAAQRGRSFRA